MENMIYDKANSLGCSYKHLLSLSALYVPPEKQRPKAMRKHWSPLNNPGKEARLKMKKVNNYHFSDSM